MRRHPDLDVLGNWEPVRRAAALLIPPGEVTQRDAGIAANEPTVTASLRMSALSSRTWRDVRIVLAFETTPAALGACG